MLVAFDFEACRVLKRVWWERIGLRWERIGLRWAVGLKERLVRGVIQRIE